MKYIKTERFYRLIYFTAPFLLWGILITIYYFFGFKIVFKSVFNFLLGLLYAYGSFICAYYYNKNLRCERIKDSFNKTIEFKSNEQYELDQKRRDKFYEEFSRYSTEYHGASKMLYILQGIIAFVVSIEFLLGWA
jgi:hypothetical protein